MTKIQTTMGEDRELLLNLQAETQQMKQSRNEENEANEAKLAEIAARGENRESKLVELKNTLTKFQEKTSSLQSNVEDLDSRNKVIEGAQKNITFWYGGLMNDRLQNTRRVEAAAAGLTENMSKLANTTVAEIEGAVDELSGRLATGMSRLAGELRQGFFVHFFRIRQTG